MAKMDYGYLGGFRGKLGTAVGYQWNGKWCMRSRPRMVKNPRTEAQQANRTLFGEEVRLAAHMSWAINRTLTPMAREAGMTAYNLFVSLNQQAFSLVDGRLEVDYPHLMLSMGPVAPVSFGTPTMTEDLCLSVDFEKNMQLPRAKAYDSVSLFVYCPSWGYGYLAAPVYRKSKRISMMLPSLCTGRELQVYGFVEDAQGNFSETIYVGTVSGEEETVGSGERQEEREKMKEVRGEREEERGEMKDERGKKKVEREKMKDEKG